MIAVYAVCNGVVFTLTARRISVARQARNAVAAKVGVA